MTDVTTNNREVDADDVAGAEESAKHVVDERTAVRHEVVASEGGAPLHACGARCPRQGRKE